MSYDPQQYLDEHKDMWARFMRWTVYLSVGVAITLILMAVFLV